VMSAYKKYRCLWAVPLPPSADEPDGPVDVHGAEFDSYEAAESFARHRAAHGPRPDWRAVIEVRRKPARSVLRADLWIESQLWECGRLVLELKRPDREYLRDADSSAA